MDYLPIKHAHLTLVAISLMGFSLRAAGRWLNAAWMKHRAVRVVPHVVDTLLLVSGISLWVMAGFGAVDWLIFKMVMLLVYIGAGIVVLRPATATVSRAVASVIAIASVFAMLSAALHKQIPLVTN